MHDFVVMLSIPGLRAVDVAVMARLSELAMHGGAVTPLQPTFPCVTCPVQMNLTTGTNASQHGIVANGLYDRETGEVEMWTLWNETVEQPQIWDRLHQHDPAITSAVWFPMLSKGAGADFICTPAPIHNPDGSESLWCYTRPEELYGEYMAELGHFPLMNFWGPMASIKATDWICHSAVMAARRFQPRFSYIYLPHLDYATQKNGPDSAEAMRAVGELDRAIGVLIDGFRDAGMEDILWLVASSSTGTRVSQVIYANRILRGAGYLTLRNEHGHEHLVPGESAAWALADHQLSHVFVAKPEDVEPVAQLFRNQPGIAEVLIGDERSKRGMDHPRCGEIVLISQPEAWFAYYWWEDDACAPEFARTVDIHRKPGYDPVELFLDTATMSTPLDATLVKGSHGVPAEKPEQLGVLLSSDSEAMPMGEELIRDTDVAGIVLRNFGATGTEPMGQPV